MRIAGWLVGIVGAVLLLGAIINTAAALQTPSSQAWGVAVGGLAISLLVLAAGIWLIKRGAGPTKPKVVGGYRVGWLDEPFINYSWIAIIGLTVFLSGIMWLVSGLDLLFGSHPVARRRAGWIFGSLSFLILLVVLNIVLLVPKDDSAAIAAAPELAATVPADFVRRTTDDPAFYFRTPRSWQMQPVNGPMKVKLRMSPAGGSVNLVTVPQDAGQTITGTLAKLPAYLEKEHPDLKVVQSDVVKLAGRPAGRFSYELTNPSGERVRLCQYVLLKDGQEYVLTYGAPVGLYDTLLPSVQAAAVSMHLPGEPMTPDRPVIASGPIPRSESVRIPPRQVDRTPSAPALTAPTVIHEPSPVAASQSPAAQKSSNDLPDTGPGDRIWVRDDSVRPPQANPVRPSFGAHRSGLALRIHPNAPTPPAAAQAAEQFAAAEKAWQPASGAVVDLLPTFTGTGLQRVDGNLVLEQSMSISTPRRFTPPVDFRMVLLTNDNDTRLAYAANEIIFNWEMRPTEFRVGGGPANGRHKPGVGELPANRWTAVEMKVTATDMTLWVDGHQIYQTAADFSQINQPLRITAHRGQVQVHSVSVIDAKD